MWGSCSVAARYVCGGSEQHGALNTAERFDPCTGRSIARTLRKAKWIEEAIGLVQ